MKSALGYRNGFDSYSRLWESNFLIRQTHTQTHALLQRSFPIRNNFCHPWIGL